MKLETAFLNEDTAMYNKYLNDCTINYLKSPHQILNTDSCWQIQSFNDFTPFHTISDKETINSPFPPINSGFNSAKLYKFIKPSYDSYIKPDLYDFPSCCETALKPHVSHSIFYSKFRNWTSSHQIFYLQTWNHIKMINYHNDSLDFV